MTGKKQLKITLPPPPRPRNMRRRVRHPALHRAVGGRVLHAPRRVTHHESESVALVLGVNPFGHGAGQHSRRLCVRAKKREASSRRKGEAQERTFAPQRNLPRSFCRRAKQEERTFHHDLKTKAASLP